METTPLLGHSIKERPQRNRTIAGIIVCATVFVFALGIAFAPELRNHTTDLDTNSAIEQKVLSGGDSTNFAELDQDRSADACVATSKVAHEGVDLVAYFSLPENALPINGSAAYAETYKGYTYYFSSAANQAAFAAEPTRYLPAWGGFCSYGVALETFWTWAEVEAIGILANMKVWRIYDVGNGQQRLFFFMYAQPLRMWEETDDILGLINTGNLKWANWTRGHFYSNTDCFWSSVDCGHYADDCII